MASNLDLDSNVDLQNNTTSSFFSPQFSQFWTSLPPTLGALVLDNMPSFRSLTSFLLSTSGIVQSTLVNPLTQFDSGTSAVCHHPKLSCHNTSVVENLCCFNAPGGSLLQTQFWDTDPASGPDESWTIHGLWPDHCDGTYSSHCDDSRAYKNISAILRAAGDEALLRYMHRYWTSDQGSAESFWQHEWGKHGTCISTLKPDCYSNYKPTEEVPDFFRRVVQLFKSLPSYKWLKEAGIVPSTTKTYERSQIENALSKHHDGMKVYLGCYNGQLDEIWYYFNVRGSVQTGKFVPSENVGSASSCPANGIKYLPKGSSSSPTSATSSTGSSTSATPTGTPFSGKGYLNVITSGSKKGCIISYGTWYTTGTCATFTASSSSDGFTLASSKGSCAVQSGELTCGSNVSSATTFSADGKSLSYNGKTTFHADAVPSGKTQGTVYTGSDGHAVSLSIEWHTV